MPFGITRNPSLSIQPRLPVWIRWLDGTPKIIAGGVPVVPFNTALGQRARHDGATRKSLAAYARPAERIRACLDRRGTKVWIKQVVIHGKNSQIEAPRVLTNASGGRL